MDPNDVYQILVEECGAHPSGRTEFAVSFADDREHGYDTEYRFGGYLGFGGKLHYQSRPSSPTPVRVWVSCYPEDRTAERVSMVLRANNRLSRLTLKEQG